MNPMHDEHALAAAYVLGALDPDERRTFEAHAATCSVCQEEVRSLQRVAAALAHAVPQRTPNPEVRARVLSTIAGAAPHAAPVRTLQAGSGSWLPLAAAVVLTVAMGAYAWSLQQRLSTLEVRLNGAERRASAAERDTLEARRVADNATSAMAVLAAPDLTRIDLAGQPIAPQATARALWSRNRGMVFTTADLPPAPAGRVYQLWVIAAGKAVSAGLLALDPSGRTTAVFQTPPDIGTPSAVAVTLEPAGGVPEPTGDRYLIGTPAAGL